MSCSSPINLHTFVYGFGGFGILLFIQILVWQISKLFFGPIGKQILAIFVIFIGIPILAMLFSHEISGTLLILSLSSGYIPSFPAAVAQSPSFEILILVRSFKNKGGIKAVEIFKRLASTRLLEDRLRDLASDGLIQSGNEIQLSPAGRMVARFFYQYRRLLRLPKGSG